MNDFSPYTSGIYGSLGVNSTLYNPTSRFVRDIAGDVHNNSWKLLIGGGGLFYREGRGGGIIPQLLSAFNL